MYDFTPDPNVEIGERYRQLYNAADSLTANEPDGIANMANVAAILWEFLPNLNWAGFYRIGESKSGGKELILGPFVGRPACIRIPLDRGVCGAAATSCESQLVDDVHAFPGHIACDAASRSELVVPITRDEDVIAIIDLDSPIPARFTEDDRQGVERLARLLGNRI